MSPERELPFAAAAFNLITESGVDPVREIMDKLREAEARAKAREYELKMQRVFAECPGFIGGDAPQGERSIGNVVVDPARVVEARGWLKQRFILNDVVEIDSAAGGIRIEVAPKPKRVRAARVRAVAPVNFNKPEQYELSL